MSKNAGEEPKYTWNMAKDLLSKPEVERLACLWFHSDQKSIDMNAAATDYGAANTHAMATAVYKIKAKLRKETKRTNRKTATLRPANQSRTNDDEPTEPPTKRRCLAVNPTSDPPHQTQPAPKREVIVLTPDERQMLEEVPPLCGGPDYKKPAKIPKPSSKDENTSI